ncbi:MAG: MBL fold metallo-hydrolase [Lachnospiraceae bacterium]|nr:MBL fold metallo-hydrolase [Lachnospiraceae bacterium]
MTEQISEKISYISCSAEPLSADIGIIKTDNGVWLYDCGNDINSIAGLGGSYNIVLSHFHPDHTGNLDKLGINELYISKETAGHIKRPGVIVEKDLYIGELHIFPLRSCHAKGCLALEVDESWCFVGDALYGREKAGRYSYNAQLLKEETEQLKKLKARYLLVSHYPGLVRDKAEVIGELESIYALRQPGEPEIAVRK